MATISRSFESVVSDTSLSGVAVTTGTYSDHIDLTAHEGAHVIVDAVSTGTTDNLIVEVYPSIDGGTDYDDIPISSFEIVTTGVDAQQSSFIVDSVAGFRVLTKRSGTTDSIDTTMESRRWRYVTT